MSITLSLLAIREQHKLKSAAVTKQAAAVPVAPQDSTGRTIANHALGAISGAGGAMFGSGAGTALGFLASRLADRKLGMGSPLRRIFNNAASYAPTAGFLGGGVTGGLLGHHSGYNLLDNFDKLRGEVKQAAALPTAPLEMRDIIMKNLTGGNPLSRVNQPADYATLALAAGGLGAAGGLALGDDYDGDRRRSKKEKAMSGLTTGLLLGGGVLGASKLSQHFIDDSFKKRMLDPASGAETLWSRLHNKAPKSNIAAPAINLSSALGLTDAGKVDLNKL